MSSSSLAAGPSSSYSFSKKRERKNLPADKTTVISSRPPSKADIPTTDAHLGLLVEQLTFNPRAFIDALVYVANEALYRLGEDFEPKAMQFLVDTGMPEHDAEREAEKATHSIMTLLENALDHVFDTLELYSLQSVFGLTTRQASHIVLPHHAGLDLRSRGQSHAATSNTAQSESTELSQRQRVLNRKISAARATSHALTLALQASQRRLTRIRGVHALALTLLGPQASSLSQGEDKDQHPSSIAEATTRLGHAVSVIKANRAPLLAGIDKLRNLDPLGEALIHSTSSLGSMDEAAAETKPKAGQTADQPWSSGREGYLRWQTERMLSSSQRSMGAGVESSTEEGSGDVISAGDASYQDRKGSRKRKSALAGAGDDNLSAAASKGRPSVPLHLSEGGMEGEEVGKTGEMEQLAALIQRRPVAAAEGSTTGAATTPAKGRASTSRKSRN